jgi:hypothetical protein
MRRPAWTRGRTRMTVTVVITLLLALLGVTTASPAQASGCFAASCGGWDPVSKGCSATSTTAASGAWGTVWNRYSAGCRANWVRGQLSTAAVNAGYQLWISIETTDSTGAGAQACYPIPGSVSNHGYVWEPCYGGGPIHTSSIIYSDMVDGTKLTQAYMDIFDASSNLVAIYEADQ